jgi:hypothetical protein
MAESSSTGTIILPSLPIMLSSSEDTRKGVVTTLGEQYQRMLQAKPLQATMSAGVGRGTSTPQKNSFFAKPAEKTNSGEGMYAALKQPLIPTATESGIHTGRAAAASQYESFSTNLAEMTNSGEGIYAALKQSLLPTTTESGIHTGRAAAASQNKSFFAIAASSERNRMPIPQSSSQKHPITKVLRWQPSVHPDESVLCAGTLVRKGMYLVCLDCQHGRGANQLAFIFMIYDDGVKMGIPMIFIASTCHSYLRGPDKYKCLVSRFGSSTCEFLGDMTSHLRDGHTPLELREAFFMFQEYCLCDAGNYPRGLERVRGHEVSCAVRIRCLEEAEKCGVDADFVLSQ